MPQQSLFQSINTLEDMILIMRFNTKKPLKESFTYLSYKKISLLTGISQLLIKQICMKQNKQIINKNSNQKGKQLSQEMINFITSQETLQKQAGKTLQQRCIIFHRQFPNQFLSKSQLRQIYQNNQIKRKVIKMVKHTTLQQDQNKIQLIEQMKFQIQTAIKQNMKLIFLDEVMFTYATNQKLDYSNINENIINKDKLGLTKSIAVVAAISFEQGLEEFYCFSKSIDTDKFMDFLLGLHDKNNQKPIALVLDNLRVHHSKKVKELCEELQITTIFTPPYSPEFNPIENYFSLVKNQYKRMKINKISNGQRIMANSLVKQSFMIIDNEVVKNLCMKKLNQLGLFQV